MRRTIRCGLLSAALASALFAQSVAALTPQTTASPLTRGVERTESGVDRLDGRYKADGVAITLGEPAFSAKAAAPETMAREFLAARHQQLGLKADEASSLARTTLREGRHFSVVRFEQRHQGLPVYGSDIAVSVRPDGKVIYVANSAVGGLGAPVNADNKTDADALTIAKQYLGVSEPGYQKLRKMVYASPNGTRIVWRVDVVAKSSELGGRWEVLVDAQSGEVLRAQDKSSNAEGTGTVWTPDPLSYEKVAYGGGYVDGNNADTPELTAALVSVTLPDISQDGSGNYVLSGPYAVCKDWDTPHHTGECPVQASNDFSVTRSAESFDAVMVYYHISRYMKYVNETLDVTAMPLVHTGGVVYDPHGWNGQDNSRYTGGANDLTFGQGGVDDAQDADVIVHELGHGLHDWITGGHLSQVQGLSEGFGDYTAGSYSRDFPDQWTPTDEAYNWVYNWDGHSDDTWDGRVLNWHLDHTYADIADDGEEIHIAGQYWASCNLEARKNVQALDAAGGGQAFDKAYFQGVSMTGGNTNQKDAAQAVINAAAALGYTQAQIDAIGVAYNSGNQSGNTGCTYGVTVPGAGTDPKIVVDPTALSGSAAAGASTTAPLTIKNTGGGSLNWSIVEAAAAARSHFPSEQRRATPIGSTHGPRFKYANPRSSASAAPLALSTPFGGAVNGYAENSFLGDGDTLVSLDFTAPGTLTAVGPPNNEPLWGSGFLNGDTGTLYMLGDSGLFSVDTATGATTEISADAGGGDVWGMTVDPTTQTLYWIGPTSDQSLSTVDPTTGATTLIGAITGAAVGDTINSIAADAQGRLYGTLLDGDSLISIDKTTGDTAVIGSLGVDVSGVVGLAFDLTTGTLYLASETMYTVDVASGATTPVGAIQDGAQLVAMAIGGGGTTPGGCTNPSDVPWLSASPTSGTATAGGSSAVTVTLNATGLAAGSYDANLCIASNDATNPLVTVPVSFTVTGGGSDPCSASDTIFCDGFDGTGGGTFEQPVKDPSFEATDGSTGTNPDWTGVDDNSSSGGTPFWAAADTNVEAHTGTFLAWGGGWGAASSQNWSQSVTIASGGARYLNFWRFFRVSPAGGTATLKVSVDGTQVWTMDLLTSPVDTDWTKVSVDLSSYADDAAHEIRFDYAATGSTDGEAYVDDVTVEETAAAAQPRPAHPPVAGNPNAGRTKHR